MKLQKGFMHQKMFQTPLFLGEKFKKNKTFKIQQKMKIQTDE